MDRNILVVSGNGVLEQYGIIEDQMVPQDLQYSGFPKPVSSLSFTDHQFTELNHLVTCTKSGELFVFQMFELLANLKVQSPPAGSEQSNTYQVPPAYSCIATYRENNFCAGTEEGWVHFFRFDSEKKNFYWLRSWTCMEIKFTKIISMSAHELSKAEVELAICAQSENIVHINVQKQIYSKSKMPSDS